MNVIQFTSLTSQYLWYKHTLPEFSSSSMTLLGQDSHLRTSWGWSASKLRHLSVGFGSFQKCCIMISTDYVLGLAAVTLRSWWKITSALSNTRGSGNILHLPAVVSRKCCLPQNVNPTYFVNTHLGPAPVVVWMRMACISFYIWILDPHLVELSGED